MPHPRDHSARSYPWHEPGGSCLVVYGPYDIRAPSPSRSVRIWIFGWDVKLRLDVVERCRDLFYESDMPTFNLIDGLCLGIVGGSILGAVLILFALLIVKGFGLYLFFGLFAFSVLWLGIRWWRPLFNPHR